MFRAVGRSKVNKIHTFERKCVGLIYIFIVKEKIMEHLSIKIGENSTELISIEEKSAPFLLFVFSNQTAKILAALLLAGWILGMLGKYLVFKRLLIQPLISYPVNLLILIDEVGNMCVSRNYSS